MSRFQRRLNEKFRRYRKNGLACRADPSHPGLEGIRVSISHDGDYAMAFALVMQR